MFLQNVNLKKETHMFSVKQIIKEKGKLFIEIDLQEPTPLHPVKH
jgi:hypothetical protein